MIDHRVCVCNTKEYEGFLPCPFCGSKNQDVLENATLWGETVVFTVALACTCGMEVPIKLEFDKLENGHWEKAIRGRIDDIRRRWNNRWSDDNG